MASKESVSTDTKSKTGLPSALIKAMEPEYHPPPSAWIQTFTGRKFYPLNPRAEDICINDIAHALACTARFGGHTREFYSVAQHSCEVAKLVPSEDMLWGLLHDAAEAYLGDLPRPIKHDAEFGHLFREAEDLLMVAMCERYDLDLAQPVSVEDADCRLLATEKRDLLVPMQGGDDPEWMHGKADAAPLSHVLRPLLPKDAEHEFLRLWNLITAGRFSDVKVVHRPQRTGGRGNLGPMYADPE